MFAQLHVNRLQRKVLLVVLVIIVVPMWITGVLSASWVAHRLDDSIERWIREAAQVNRTWLDTVNQQAKLFASVLAEVNQGHYRLAPGRSPVPRQLQPLARELGINLVQVYGPDAALLYSSPHLTLDTLWKAGQASAVLKARTAERNLLAAVTIVRIPAADKTGHYRLVLGTLFDNELLQRLGRMSGLKTRLFYPREGNFEKAFSEESRPLKLRLPPSAYEQLQSRNDYYSDRAEEGHYWGLYTPVVDATGQVEAILFSGLEHRGGAQFLTDQASLALAIALLGTVLAVGTGLLLSRFVVRPVEYLRDGVMKLAAQDFRASIPLHSKDELGDLARAFNAMAASLREARDEQRREFQRDKIAALGELSLAMAHEIRNPIGVMNTAAKLLEKARDPAKAADLRRMIREESARLDQLLKDFQQLARHRQPHFAIIDPAEPLERALQVTLAGRDDVAIERCYAHGGFRIRADAQLIQQAWINLIRNAMEAMEPGPYRFTVGSALRGDTLELYLQDYGPGIPLQAMTRLFEPFFSTKDQGSGLGLTIANTLVEANGAQLELDPSTETGARFAMRFPVMEAE